MGPGEDGKEDCSEDDEELEFGVGMLFDFLAEWFLMLHDEDDEAEQGI